MSRGSVLFAHNNKEIDYLKIACTNALMISYNLKVPVTLVTDEGTLAWGKKSYPELLADCFDNIIIVDKDTKFRNTKNYADTSDHNDKLPFYNCNHSDVYRLTPYNETLFIDADYLIMSTSLSNCWGSNNDVMVSHNIYSPMDLNNPHTDSIDDLGIKLYWATVIYFRKSSLAEHLFSIINHVQHNYGYYRELYLFNNGIFRNDHAVSIAIHMLNGFTNNNPIIPELPINGLLMSWDTNDIKSVDINSMVLYAAKPGERGKFILVCINNTDIHIMNKWAIGRVSDRLISLYKN